MQRPRIRTELMHSAAHFSDGCPGFERLAVRDAHGIGKLFGKLEQHAAPFTAEDTSKHTVKVDGDDRRAAPLDDSLEPAPKREHHSGARDLPFGEDADQVPLVQVLPGVAQRTQDHPRTARCGDWNCPDRLPERLDQRMIVVRCFDDKSDRPVEAREQEQSVDERCVIGHQQRSARLRNILSSEDPHAVERMGQENKDEAKRLHRALLELIEMADTDPAIAETYQPEPGNQD